MKTGFTRLLSMHFWTQIFQTFLQACQRFPLSIVCLVVLSFLTITENHNINFLNDLKWKHSILTAVAGGFWFLAAGLFSESHDRKGFEHYRFAIPIFVLISWQIWNNVSIAPSSWTLLLAIVMAVSFAAYLFRRFDNASIWYFNYQLIAGLCFALLSTLILCGGLSLILKSIAYLFEIQINYKLYSDIWLIGWCFFIPAYFLANVPTQFDYQRSDCNFPRGVHFIQNYILTPLSLVYMVILYAYLLKTLIQWELPQGNLGKMISIFGVIGIFTHLTIYPVHERSSSLLSWFYRNFYRMMIVPLGLLILAIVVRITEYGLTESRYLVIICASWFTLLIFLNVVQGTKFQIRNVTLILAILAMVSSFGPWRIDKLPVQNQFARLQKILVNNKLLIDNRYIKPIVQPEIESQQSISSIIAYLISHKEGKKIMPWFSIPDQAAIQLIIDCDSEECRYAKGSEILKLMGIDFVGQRQNQGSFNISLRGAGNNGHFVNQNRLVPVTSYDYIIPISIYQNSCSKGNCAELIDQSWQSIDAKELTIYLKKDNTLDIAFDDVTKLIFNLNILFERIQGEGMVELPVEDAQKMILNQSSNGIKARLFINRINGVVKNEKKQSAQIEGVLLLKIN